MEKPSGFFWVWSLKVLLDNFIIIWHLIIIFGLLEKALLAQHLRFSSPTYFVSLCMKITVKIFVTFPCGFSALTVIFSSAVKKFSRTAFGIKIGNGIFSL